MNNPNNYDLLATCTVQSVLEELARAPDNVRSEIFEYMVQDYATINLHLIFNPRVLQQVWDRVFQSATYRDFLLDVSVRLKTQLVLRDTTPVDNTPNTSLIDLMIGKIAVAFSEVAFGTQRATTPIPEDTNISTIIRNSLYISQDNVQTLLSENWWLFTYICVIYYFQELVSHTNTETKPNN